MKIIHLTYSNYIGGASIAAYRIHKTLLKNDITSRMWVNKKLFDDQTVEGPKNKFREKLLDLRRYITWPLTKLIRTKNPMHYSLSLLPSDLVKKINHSDVDIVNLHWINREMISIKDISEIKKPIVWTLHDMWPFCGAEHYTSNNRWQKGYNINNRPAYESGFDLNRWIWKKKKKYWKKPMQIVTPSKWLANCTKKSRLMKDWPVSVIANPIDTNFWKPINKKIARKKLGLSSNAPLIVFGAIGGGKDPRKGYDLLLSSLNILRNNLKVKDLEIFVFGQNKPKFSKKIDFPVHYKGHIEDSLILKTIYSAADIMIVPSRLDNLPNTVIEAQACGTPVASFNIGGLSDIILHKKTGYLAKAFDTKDLAQGISWLLKKKNSLKKRVRQIIVSKFSERTISKKYINLYKKVIKNNHFN